MLTAAACVPARVLPVHGILSGLHLRLRVQQSAISYGRAGTGRRIDRHGRLRWPCRGLLFGPCTGQRLGRDPLAKGCPAINLGAQGMVPNFKPGKKPCYCTFRAQSRAAGQAPLLLHERQAAAVAPGPSLQLRPAHIWEECWVCRGQAMLGHCGDFLRRSYNLQSEARVAVFETAIRPTVFNLGLCTTKNNVPPQRQQNKNTPRQRQQNNVDSNAYKHSYRTIYGLLSMYVCTLCRVFAAISCVACGHQPTPTFKYRGNLTHS